MTSGTGVYFDGQTSRRQDVHVALGSALEIRRADGGRIADWPLDELRELDSPKGLLRMTREGGLPMVRLEVRDLGLAEAIRAAAPRLDAARAAESGTARKVVGWSVAAVISLSLFGFFGIPALAEAVTPLLPWSVDRNMGHVADQQLRLVVPTNPGGFECGGGAEEKPGREVLDRLTKRLEQASGLPIPIRIVAVRSDFVNALALPGSPIYLFDGLVQKANTPDELVGVLAHEVGHVAHRDGTRLTLQAGGASLLFGFILGDVVGGAATIAAVQALAQASYSRDAERAADRYSVELMKKLGADPRAMGGFLVRLTDEAEDEADAKPEGVAPTPAPDGEAKKADSKPAEDRKAEIERDGGGVTEWLSSHPATVERRRAIDAAAGDGPIKPSLDERDFAALKRICAKAPDPDQAPEPEKASEPEKTPDAK